MGSGKLLVFFREDVAVLGFRHEEGADHHRHQGDDDRISKPVIDIPRLRDHGEAGGRQQPTEPAIADVVGQRHGGIANTRWE